GRMDYPLNASATRRALSLAFTAVGALAWAWLAAGRADDGWGLPASLGAALIFVAVCALEWRAAARREPCAIRLMGAQRAILHYPAAPVPRGRRAAPRAVEVTIERIVHWPGRLAGLRLAPASLPSGPGARPPAVLPARDVLIFADTLPEARFHSLGIQLRCIGRGVTLVEYR
ncbi:MAG: hypothetical protein ACRYHA_16720, partial [Janthinobacterium lividum]